MSYKIWVQKNSAPFDLNLDFLYIFMKDNFPKRPYFGLFCPIDPFLRCAYDYMHGKLEN